MIILHVTYKMKAEDRAGFVQDLLDHKIHEKTEMEPGCIQYRFSLPLDCEDEVLLNEGWENEEVLSAHFESPTIQVLKELKEAHNVVSDVKKYILPAD